MIFTRQLSLFCGLCLISSCGFSSPRPLPGNVHAIAFDAVTPAGDTLDRKWELEVEFRATGGDWKEFTMTFPSGIHEDEIAKNLKASLNAFAGNKEVSEIQQVVNGPDLLKLLDCELKFGFQHLEGDRSTGTLVLELHSSDGIVRENYGPNLQSEYEFHTQAPDEILTQPWGIEYTVHSVNGAIYQGVASIPESLTVRAIPSLLATAINEHDDINYASIVGSSKGGRIQLEDCAVSLKVVPEDQNMQRPEIEIIGYAAK